METVHDHPGEPPPAPFAGPPPGMMFCPHCRSVIPLGAPLCAVCRAITTPDGVYRGPPMTAPGAVASLVCGIIGLLLCGVVLGPIAIAQASSARRAIAMDPRLSGGGMATAGLVLGILDLVGWAIVVMLRLSAIH